MNIFSRFRRKTDFRAGGLKLTAPDVMCKVMSPMRLPGKFVAPYKLDFRDMCTQTSNQGPTPHCAGYATAGHIEVYKWQTQHYPEQVDGDAIYAEAKKIDGDSTEGTTLNAAARAALNLKLIKGSPQYIVNGVEQVKFAIHQFATFVGGFLITDEFNYASNKGEIPVIADAKPLGGHSMLVCGYDEEFVYIQNSWGIDWGLFGFCRLSWPRFINRFMSGLVIRAK